MEPTPKMQRTVSFSNVLPNVDPRRRLNRGNSAILNRNTIIPKTIPVGNKVSLEEMGKLVHEPDEHIRIKDGIIYRAVGSNFDSLEKALQEHTETKNTLLVAAKLLSKKKLDKHEKPFEDSALKIIDYYNKESEGKKVKKELKLGLNQAAGVVQNRIGEITDSMKINDYAKRYQRDTYLEKVRTQFKDQNLVNNNDGVDVDRYVAAGVVNIKERKKNEQNEIKNTNVIENRPNVGEIKGDKEQQKEYVNRTEIILGSFAEKATNDEEAKAQLRNGIANLLDIMRNDEDVLAAGASLDQQMRKWSVGTPAEKNMMKLVHSMNQGFTDGVLKPLRTMAHDSPGLLLKMGQVEVDIKHPFKNVEYQFDGNEVKVKHTCISEVSQEGKVKVLLKQEALLSAKLDNLSDWDFSEQLSVMPPENTDEYVISPEKTVEFDKTLAEKFYRLSSDSGFNTKLTTPK